MSEQKEDAIEAAFWEFDARKKGMSQWAGRPQSERDAFKWAVRGVHSGSRPINCDQVAWLLDVFHRHLPPSEWPRVSREREMRRYAMLYEVMEVAGLCFQDASARHNGTPPEARHYPADGEAKNVAQAEEGWSGPSGDATASYGSVLRG